MGKGGGGGGGRGEEGGEGVRVMGKVGWIYMRRGDVELLRSRQGAELFLGDFLERRSASSESRNRLNN